MHPDFSLRFAVPDGHQQGLQRQVGVGAALPGPPNNAPRKQIDDDCEIKEALVGADVGDICDPELVGGVDIELPIQGVVRHDSRTAAIRNRRLL
jgi:hypothetical protein